MTKRGKAPMQPRAEQTRAKLTSAARKLFGKRRYDRVSIEDIVAEAGVSKGAFYFHFPSKKAIFKEVVRDIISKSPDLAPLKRRERRPIRRILLEHSLGV